MITLLDGTDPRRGDDEPEDWLALLALAALTLTVLIAVRRLGRSGR